MDITVEEDQTNSSDICQIYNITVSGKRILTTVTVSATVVNNWISNILCFHRRRLQTLIVGLDIEWRPNRSRSSDNPVALLQLCVGKRCLIFQLLYADFIPQSLHDFLSDSRFRFVGVGVTKDAEKLLEDYELHVINTVNVEYVASEVLNMTELRRSGLKTLARVIFDLEIVKPKRVTMSRWDSSWLTVEQIQYACVDAFLSFEIGIYLISRMDN